MFRLSKNSKTEIGEYALLYPIKYRVDGREFTLNTMVFYRPKQAHLTNEFIPVIKNLSKIPVFLEMIETVQKDFHFEQTGNLSNEVENLYNLINQVSNNFQKDISKDAINLEVNFIDAIRQMFFPSDNTNPVLLLAQDKENKNFITAEEFKLTDCHDVNNIYNGLRDFFFANFFNRIYYQAS